MEILSIAAVFIGLALLIGANFAMQARIRRELPGHPQGQFHRPGTLRGRQGFRVWNVYRERFGMDLWAWTFAAGLALVLLVLAVNIARR